MVKRTFTVPLHDVPPHAAKYQRVDPTKEQRVLDNMKRLRTDNVTRDPTDSSEVVQREVHRTLLDRLQQSAIPLDDTTIASLNFLWPSTYPGLWLKLLNHPLSLTDEELWTILEVEDSRLETPDPELGDQIYYVRSFKLRVRDLRWIAVKFLQEGRYVEQATAWRDAVKFLQDDKESVYVRYIGTSTVVSALERFNQDCLNHTGGLYGYFCATLLERYPSSTCTICTFSEATTRSFGYINGTLFRLHADHTDIREQALIALFNRNVLLNRQVGGRSVAYQPSQRDIMRFEALRTQVASKFLPETSHGYAEPTTKMKQLVKAWMDSVAKFSNAHSADLGTDKMPITKDMKKAWADQATPCTFYGKVVAVFIGDYCPVAAMQNPGSFWRQDIRACKYLKDTLARLMAFECGESRWKPEDLNVLADNAILPWVDYQYTTQRDAYRWESAELMRQYLDVVRPLIVSSFEKGVSSVLRKDFGALYNEHEFHPMVGVPEIHYHNHRGEIFDEGNKAMRAELPVDPDDCYIHIPSVHPGMERYDYGASEVRRILDMTMWEVMLMIDCALEILKEGFFGPRYQLCVKILAMFEQRWVDSGVAAVFVEAKRDLVRFFATKPGRYTLEPLKAYRKQWNGRQVNINLSGIISVYWEKPDGTQVKVRMAGGRDTNVHAPKNATGADAIRTIHFLPDGIDIRDHAGKSMLYTLYRRSFTKPTFPGHIMRAKLAEDGMSDMIELWEHETRLNFDATVPKDAIILGSACQNCAVNRETCGNARPCARCVRMKLECKPQTLLTKKKYEKKSMQTGNNDA